MSVTIRTHKRSAVIQCYTLQTNFPTDHNMNGAADSARCGEEGVEDRVE